MKSRNTKTPQPESEVEKVLKKSPLFKELERLPIPEGFLKLLSKGKPEALLGLMAGIVPELPVEIPDWAKNASQKFWQAFGINGFNAESAGKMIGLGERTPETGYLSGKISHTEVCAAFNKDMANAPAEESKKYFDGRAAAPALDAKFAAMAQREKIYFIISIQWQKVAALKSTAELFTWLKSYPWENGIPLLASATDSREIRAVCESIGLNFKNLGGRPRKKNPAVKK